MFTIADHHFGDTDLTGPAERLMQNGVGFFSTFLRLQEIRPVEKLWINLFQIHEIGDVNGMRGLDPNLLKILILHDDITTALVFEALHNLIGWNFLRVGLRDLFVSDWAEIAGTKLPKAKLFLARGRVNRHRNINQPKADAAFPNRSHMGVLPTAG